MITRSLNTMANSFLALSFITFIFMIFNIDGMLMLMIPFLMVTSLLTTYLSPLGTRKYLGFLPLPLLLFFVPIAPLYLMVVLLVLAVQVYSLNRGQTHMHPDVIKDMYKKFLIGLISLALIIALFNWINNPHDDIAIGTLSLDFMAYSMSYLVVGGLLLRLLRHDDAVREEKTFFLRSSIPLIGVLVSGFLFSRPAFFSFVSNIIVFLWRAVVITIFQGFAWLITRPFVSSEVNFLINFQEAEPFEAGGGGFANTEYTEPRYFIIEILIVLGLIGILILVVKAILSKKTTAKTQTTGMRENRTYLGELPKKDKKKSLLPQPDDEVRKLYQKMLVFLKKKEWQLDENVTSLDVSEKITVAVEEEVAQTMRHIYLPIRYGKKSGNSDEVALMKRAFLKIKGKIEEK